MLTIEDVFKLAQQHQLQFSAHYAASTTSDLTPPKPTSLSIWFRKECVDAWVVLMTHTTEVPVALHGTRQCTGSGATDGRLFESYAQRLEEVNHIRATLGLQRVFG